MTKKHHVSRRLPCEFTFHGVGTITPTEHSTGIFSELPYAWQLYHSSKVHFNFYIMGSRLQPDVASFGPADEG